MTTPSDKPQTYRRANFTDGSFANIVSNLNPEPGEPIIDRIDWLHGKGTWPAEIIDAIIGGWQWHADWRWQSFEQAMTLPSGRVLCWRFRPQEPCTACLQSSSTVVGKGLFDAPPTKLAPETADDYRYALRRTISPKMFAASLASLPAEAQARIIGKYLVDPPVRRRVKITTRRTKSKP